MKLHPDAGCAARCLDFNFQVCVFEFRGTGHLIDPNHFTYPLWPPAKMVDLVHWYGRTFDPPLMARPAWWRATIWIDALFFGPFYAFAIYAFIKGKTGSARRPSSGPR